MALHQGGTARKSNRKNAMPHPEQMCRNKLKKNTFGTQTVARGKKNRRTNERKEPGRGNNICLKSEGARSRDAKQNDIYT